jgi:hypothetical protein
MITPAYSFTATERVLPRLALDFTTAVTDSRVATARAGNTATRFNPSGLIETVNANLARYDFNPSTLICSGQLIEEARTNLFLNSLIDGINLATQIVVLTNVAHTLSFYGSGTVTISGGHSATVVGTGNFPSRRTLTFTPTVGASTFTVSGDVKFAQLEVGSFATSYIPTAATSVLRNADVVSMTGTNFSDWYNASDGTFVVEGSVQFGTTRYLIGGSASQRLVYGTSSGSLGIYDGTNVVNVAGGVAGQTFKIATSYGNAFGLAASLNGSVVAKGSYSGAFSVLTSIGIFSTNVGTATASGYAKKIYYYPLQLTDSEVRAFSK